MHGFFLVTSLSERTTIEHLRLSLAVEENHVQSLETKDLQFLGIDDLLEGLVISTKKPFEIAHLFISTTQTVKGGSHI